MFTKHFTARDAKVLLDRIVKDHGADHTAGTDDADGCTYYTEDSNGRLRAVCIIGQFFDYLGMLGVLFTSDPTYGSPEQHGTCDPSSWDFWNSAESHGLTFDADAKSLMRYAQTAQDGGVPWGGAVQYAADRLVYEAGNKAHQSLTGDPFAALPGFPAYDNEKYQTV